MKVFLILCFAVPLICGQNVTQRLTCEPGETRDFVYSSDSNLWGQLNQKVRLTADVSVTCMGLDPSRDQAFKYMVKIGRVVPRITGATGIEDIKPPLEVRRLKRGAFGDWLKGAWGTVKEWFSNFFLKKRSRSELPEDIDLDIGSRCRTKKSLDSDRRSRARDPRFQYDPMLGLPYEFVQSSNGRLVDIKFSDKETDSSVKNLKKHIADVFATQLDGSHDTVVESSPIGQHLTKYSVSGKGTPLKQADIGLVKLVAAAFSTEPGMQGDQAPVNVVRDITQDGVIKMATDEMTKRLKDGQVVLSAKQVQQVSDGRVTASVGILSVSLLPEETDKIRSKRSTDRDDLIGDHLKIKTEYTLKLASKRARRSIDGAALKKLEQEEIDYNLISESLIAKSKPKDSEIERLADLREKMAEILSKQKDIFGLMKSSNPNQDNVFSILSELLDLEYALDEDIKTDSVSSALRNAIKIEKIEHECGRRERLSIAKCRELFQTMVKAGSVEVSSFLLDSVDFSRDRQQKKSAILILGQTNRPGEILIPRLIRKFRAETDPDLRGHFALTSTSLASQKSTSTKTRGYVVDIILRELEILSCSDNGMIDLLEAIGNLGDRDLASAVVRKVKGCSNDLIRIASIHSLRKSLQYTSATSYLLDLIKDEAVSCTVKREVLEVLTSSVTKASDPKDADSDLDRYLMNDGLLNTCFEEQLLRYLGHKKTEASKYVLGRLAQVRRRARRDTSASSTDQFWDESSCKVFDNRPSDNVVAEPVRVQDGGSRRGKSVEREENVNYLTRRKCTATKKFGPKQATATIRADVINDLISEENNEYKLLSEFSVDSHFLGKDIDVGRMYMYSKRNTSRVYVNMFGRTLLDASRDNCDQSPGQPHRYSTFVPLYDFDVWAVRVSLGLRFAGEMSLNPVSSCTSDKIREQSALMMSPDINVRTSGEASAKVLVVRGGVDIGGDFNYYSDLEFAPKPELCLSAYHGHRPMNVSVQSWYSFWDLNCDEWLERNFYKPQSLSWAIAARQRSPWLSNQCLLSSRQNPDALDP
ncbi:hypothetical protein HDE_04496 [Halotydeus destructor]|nr:hypothetical protein HDE_04496 [Halotydeus destructor]